ncbi:MAG: DUF1257 domain-containing protein [Planctomycetes bacterium]|nr:DUF1257 domain-containing protein [Planctomycetota bacterium]
MSHVVEIRPHIHDPVAITAACRRLGLAEPVYGTATLFEGEATGLLLNLPGWTYPAVIDVRDGSVKFDTFEGRWGENRHLDQFLQAYAVERATLEARKKSYAVTETVLQDGSIKLSIHEGG